MMGVSRSTLSAWFKDQEWSRHATRTNKIADYARSALHMKALNAGRKIKLENLYTKITEEAARDFETFKNEPLFMAGLMIYAGEGDKASSNLVRISNSEFYLHKIFIKFTLKYLGISRSALRCALILYPEHDVEACLKKWSLELDIPESQFHKTQVIVGREAVKRLQFGVGMSILSSTAVKKRIVKWLELCAKNAGLV